MIFATSGKYQNMEKPLKHQRRLGLPTVLHSESGAKDNPLLQEDLAYLEEWERLWQMDFNPPKLYKIVT